MHAYLKWTIIISRSRRPNMRHSPPVTSKMKRVTSIRRSLGRSLNNTRPPKVTKRRLATLNIRSNCRKRESRSSNHRGCYSRMCGWYPRSRISMSTLQWWWDRQWCSTTVSTTAIKTICIDSNSTTSWRMSRYTRTPMISIWPGGKLRS